MTGVQTCALPICVLDDPTDLRLSYALLSELFHRHQAGDWGEVDEHDRQENELSLREGFRLMSVYTLPNGVKLWVITEWDRSVTTVLLPDEY